MAIFRDPGRVGRTLVMADWSKIEYHRQELHFYEARALEESNKGR
jgi:hypothetical protein